MSPALAGRLLTTGPTREAPINIILKCMWHVVVQQKPLQHCKAIILQVKIKKKLDRGDLMTSVRHASGQLSQRGLRGTGS